jgi:hypothetical protein
VLVTFAIALQANCDRHHHTDHSDAFFGWLGEWMKSPGFGGLAAVVAAVVAFIGVSRTVKAQREATRRQQWWERARWALNLTLDDESSTRAVGFEVLDALANSEYAEEHEAEVIDAAVNATLEAYATQSPDGDVPVAPEDAGANEANQAHLTPETEDNHD